MRDRRPRLAGNIVKAAERPVSEEVCAMNQSEREKAMTLLLHQKAYICRFRFARSGSLSYVGHLDLMRTFERSLRRAGLPLLHSQGYNPRPMMVFALPLGVGISTTDDYLDVSCLLYT